VASSHHSGAETHSVGTAVADALARLAAPAPAARAWRDVPGEEQGALVLPRLGAEPDDDVDPATAVVRTPQLAGGDACSHGNRGTLLSIALVTAICQKPLLHLSCIFK